VAASSSSGVIALIVKHSDFHSPDSCLSSIFPSSAAIVSRLRLSPGNLLFSHIRLGTPQLLADFPSPHQRSTMAPSNPRISDVNGFGVSHSSPGDRAFPQSVAFQSLCCCLDDGSFKAAGRGESSEASAGRRAWSLLRLMSGQRFAIGRQFRAMSRVTTGIALGMLLGRARGEPDSGARPAVSRSVDTSARGSQRPRSSPREDADSPLAGLLSVAR
jgi:hypothetical protein